MLMLEINNASMRTWDDDYYLQPLCITTKKKKEMVLPEFSKMRSEAHSTESVNCDTNMNGNPR